jgi:hypothetical protein
MGGVFASLGSFSSVCAVDLRCPGCANNIFGEEECKGFEFTNEIIYCVSLLCNESVEGGGGGETHFISEATYKLVS